MQEKKEVQLADLDWEDRERVLRLLFAKMNTGQPASNWRNEGGSSGPTRGSAQNNNALNKSFREEDEDEEGGVENAAYFQTEGANIFSKEIGKELSSRGFQQSDREY